MEGVVPRVSFHSCAYISGLDEPLVFHVANVLTLLDCIARCYSYIVATSSFDSERVEIYIEAQSIYYLHGSLIATLLDIDLNFKTPRVMTY